MREATTLLESDYSNTVLYFTAPWCGPCRMLGPIMEDFSKQFDSLTFIKINVDDAQEVSIKHGVQSIPTVKLFINGEEKKSFVGLNPKQNYEAAFREYSE